MLKIRGFTLIELLLVIIIVGIMAVMSVPMMRGQIKRTCSLEAEAGLRAIAVQMRLMRSGTGSYLDIPGTPDDFTQNEKVPIINPSYPGTSYPGVPGFKIGDLTGAFFVDVDYSITVEGPDAFTAEAVGSKPEVSGVTVSIDENESITTVID
jgi:prepilin-type N-terminal cleavage/methylation domain-containing protein